MNKKQLVEMAKALGITGAAKKNVATLKELIYEKDGKEIDDYLDGIGANEYNDPKEEIKKTPKSTTLAASRQSNRLSPQPKYAR
jgi:hypothetical protein